MSVILSEQAYENRSSGILTIVPRETLIYIWPQVVPMFEKAEEFWKGYYSLEDIYIGALEGSLQLWVGIKDRKIFGTGLTALEKYPQTLVLRCLFLTGKGVVGILPACVKEIEQWAIMQGATKSEIIGRRAWETLATQYGYSKRAVVMTKQLVPHSSGDRRN